MTTGSAGPRECLRLTRSLYPKDEAEVSLLMAMISKAPCETCLFWACELIYSGFDIAPLLWSVYYDFYAQLNPGLFNKVASCLKKYRGGDIESVLMLVKTLRVKKATDNVFSLRISQTPTTFTLYKGRVPGWLAGYPAEQRPFLRAITNYDWNQIMVYISRKTGNPKELIKSVIKVMMEKRIIGMKHLDGQYQDVGSDDVVEAVWDAHGYEDEFHIVLALIVSLITPDDKIDFNTRLIKLNDAEKGYVTMLSGNGSAFQNGIAWRRLCAVSPDVAAFDIARLRHAGDGGRGESAGVAFSKEVTDYWPFHCAETPYWQHVFAKYGVVARCADKPGCGCEVEFVDVVGGMNMEDAFWRSFGFLCDLDEPCMTEMWNATCGSVATEKDIVDVMDDLFGVEEMRMEFDDVTVSTGKAATTAAATTTQGVCGDGCRGGGTPFDFSALNKLLDSI